MVPVEIRARYLRRDNYDSEQNLILQLRELDFLKEKWCELQLWVRTYQRWMAWYFNSKRKTRRFRVEDLILRKVLHNKGALDPGWEGPFKIIDVLTPSAYKLVHLYGEQILRSWNTDHLKMYYQLLYTPSSIKSLEYKNLKFKNPSLMNFELGGHIV